MTVRGIALIVLALLFGSAHSSAASGRYAAYFYPPDEIQHVRVSPNGQWLVAGATDGENSGFLAQRIGSAQVRTLRASGVKSGGRLYWIGDDTLLTYGGNAWHLSRFSANDDGSFEVDEETFHPFGWFVSALPLKDGVVVWEFERDGRNSVQLTTIDELIHYAKRLKNGLLNPAFPGKTVAEIEGSARRWIVDSDGIPRVAVRTEDDSYSVLYREGPDAPFEPIASYEGGGSDLLAPFQFTADGKRLIILAYSGRDTIGIYEYDPSTRSIVKEIYRHPIVSVDDIEFDSVTGDMLAFTYTEGTVTRRRYLDSARELFADRFGKDDPPLESLRVVSSSVDRNTFVYWVSGPREPGAHYVRIDATDETIMIGHKGAGISRELLAEVESFHVESKDGTRIEALLTLPRGVGRDTPHPLVVMPHGGPIGIQDRQTFNPMAQYLASWGYAVLQPNFRGSTGYGRAFEKAGEKQWATGMADDLDAATEVAMARPEIDGDRVCIVGGSYGGFSAVSALYRRPERFRCGVTINGVSDILLIGDTSDFADSDESMRLFERQVGSFKRDRENLIAISPAYNVSRIESPLMVIHGDRDLRVDVDHAERLLLMLELHDKPHEEMIIPEAAHSPTRKQWIEILPRVRDFLSRHTEAE